MKKVCIVQDELLPGGKTSVIVKVIEILNKRNIIPDFYSYDNFSQNTLLDGNIRFNTKKVLDFGVKGFTYYKGCFLLFLLRNKLLNYDFIFNSTHWLSSNICYDRLVNYVYYLYPLEYTEPVCPRISLQRKLYLHPLRLFNKDSSINCNSKYGAVIAISRFTKRKIEELYCPLENKVKIIYPPVDIKSFWNESIDRKRQVISVGNFEPQKDQLSQIKIAAKFPDVRFIIIGFVNAKFRKDYYNRCLAFIDSHKIKNVDLSMNVSARNLQKLFQQSQFFIHTRKYEHFGISAVEAIAAGCIPLIPDSGGQVEVVPFKDLRFNSTDDAVNKFSRVLKASTKDINNYREELQNHISKFSVEMFEEKIDALVSSYLEE